MVAQLPPSCHPSGFAAESDGPPGLLLVALGGAALLSLAGLGACVCCAWSRAQQRTAAPRQVRLPSGLLVSIPDGADS